MVTTTLQSEHPSRAIAPPPSLNLEVAARMTQGDFAQGSAVHVGSSAQAHTRETDPHGS